MVKWKTLKRSAKLKKDDQIWYKFNGDLKIAFFLKTAKVGATFWKTETTPYGSKEGQRMVFAWNPRIPSAGPSSQANVFLPRSKIIKIRREVR